MKYEQYISLIERLEKLSASNPKGYEYRVFGLALLGYLYFWLLILGLLAFPTVLVVGLFVIPDRIIQFFLILAKLWWAVIPAAVIYFGLLGGALKALTAKLPEPEGPELKQEQATELYDFIYKTCKVLKASKPSKLIITAEFNAAVAIVPRFGMFGRKTYLLLGLPLMHSLSPEQFEAVLAHEIGHISEKHGSFAKWSYQIREMWGRLLDSQELTEQHLSVLYESFVKWYFPLFSAYTFPLLREHEKEADRSAAEIVGSKPLAESLILLEVTNRTLGNTFWEDLHRQNIDSHIAPTKIFERMMEAIAAIDREQAKEELERSLKVVTTYEDSHPALSDRLKLLGYWNGLDEIGLPPLRSVSAMDKYLGSESRLYFGEFEKNWSTHFAEEWEKRHEHFKSTQKRIDEINGKLNADDMSEDDLIEKAMLVSEKEGWETALQILQTALSKFPESAAVRYNLGGVLLSMDNEDGLDHLSVAANMNPEFKIASNELSFNYLHSKGRSNEAAEFAKAIDGEYEKLKAAELERSAINPHDTFSSYQIEPELAEKICEKAGYYEEIKAIYIAQKNVFHYPEKPFVVLFIEPRPKSLINNRQDLNPNELLHIMAERFGNENIHYFQLINGTFKDLAIKLDVLEGAKIYSSK